MNFQDYNFAGKKAIVRVDFNVPLDENGNITDNTRILGALPTLQHILNQGGALIIMSHMGKPKGTPNPKYSLKQIAPAVAEALNLQYEDTLRNGQNSQKNSTATGGVLRFVADSICASAAAAGLKMGDALLLENLRFHAEEEGKPLLSKDDPAYDEAKAAMKSAQKDFARTLASYADCFVMDAFGTAHRKHASTAVIADFFSPDDKMLGLLMQKEVAAVDNVLNNIRRPFIAIMGGSKVSSKIGIIENLLGKVDRLILCGGMTYTFAKAHGGKIGNSICEDDKLDLALHIEELAKQNGVQLILAPDCIAADRFDNNANTQVCDVRNIPDGWEGLDAGPAAQALFAEAIRGCKTILWNGPAGVFEFDNFCAGSRAIANAIARETQGATPQGDEVFNLASPQGESSQGEAASRRSQGSEVFNLAQHSGAFSLIADETHSGAFSLIGGGDTVACINKFGLAQQVSYISTGGGALLEAIEGITLPAINAIKKS